MLTLKEPIKLNIPADGFTTVSDAFYERVTANYSLLSTQITPKELLFLLTAPPELPEDMGGMTTFAVENNISDSRTVTVDIINNVVNRILLSQTNSFTYQDQVYIDTVLNKLGITDVSLFMRQVQKLQSEHTDARRLLSLYRQELSLRESAPLPEEREGAAFAFEAAAEPAAPAGARYFLHSNIYKRLDTQSIYDIVNSFQQEQSNTFGSFTQNELKTSEQLNVSSVLALTELRRQLFGSTHMELTHAVNHFELGDLLPAPKTEDEVFSQAAAAALVSTVEHVLVQKLDRSQSSRAWLSLENSLSETVENTIARFQSYHSGDAIYLTPEADVTLEIKNNYKTEADALQRLVTLRQELSEAAHSEAAQRAAMASSPAIMQQLRLGDFSEETFLGDEYSSLTSATRGGDTVITPAEKRPQPGNALEPAVYMPPSEPAAPALPLPEKGIRETLLEYDVRAQRDTLRELIHHVSTPAAESAAPEEASAPSPSLPESELLQTLNERAVSSQKTPFFIKNEQKSPENAVFENTYILPSPEAENLQKSEVSQAFEPFTPAETAHPVTDSEAPPELISREVAEISRRNRERYQQIQGIRAEKIAESVPTPDVSRTMTDALRSLNSPEAVLREVLGEPTALEHKKAPLSPEASAYLAGADETTRSILETVMRFEQNPQTASGQGVLREANLGEFNAIAAVHPPQQTELSTETQRLERETVKLTEQADSLLEQYAEAPARRAAPQGRSEPLPRVAIVHKREQTGFSDELLERLEQRQTVQPVVSESTDIVTRRDIHETEINDISSKVVTQTSEDITQLVNRAISKQMGTISDKVYHQMEKRLQAERSRRGRY